MPSLQHSSLAKAGALPPFGSQERDLRIKEGRRPAQDHTHTQEVLGNKGVSNLSGLLEDREGC